MCDDRDYLMMSGIQHFSFCKRQWALIHIEKQWEEKNHTALGKLDQIRCHDGDIYEKRGDTLTIRSLRVVSHRLHLAGNCDVVEFRKNPQGISIRYCDGLWKPMPVEYKHGHSKVNDADRLQLCAQVIALEEMLSCEIHEAALYYAEIRHRETVEISEELRTKTQDMADEMWKYYQKGLTPKVKTGKYCKACSLNDLCLPRLCQKVSVKKYIDEALQENG